MPTVIHSSGRGLATLLAFALVAVLPAAARGQAMSALVPDTTTLQNRDSTSREVEEFVRRLRQLEQQRGKNYVEQPLSPAAEALPPEAKRPVIDLQRVDVSDSEILASEEIEAVVRPYIGTRVSLADLYEIVAAFDRLYAAKGFITAKAILPPQRIADGVVTIQLVEARIDRVDIEGNHHTREGYVRSRLDFEPGELVDTREAEAALRRFNRLNDVQANLVLGPGEEPGTTTYVLNLQEPPQYRFDLAVDNYGTETSGRNRVSTALASSSLTGNRDRATLGGYVTIGDDRGVEAVYGGYEIPLTSSDTRFSVYADYNDTTAKLPPAGGSAADAPTLTGSSYSVSGSISHPVFVGPRSVVRVNAGASHRHSDFELADTIALSRARLYGAEVGVNGELLDSRGIWLYAFGFEHVFDRQPNERLSPDSPEEINDNFAKLTASLFRHVNLVRDVWATARATGQYVSDDRIAGAEQFQAGGAFTVRGYPEAFNVSDNGYLTSLQLNAAVPQHWIDATKVDGLRGFVFADHAGMFSEGLDDVYLTSIGGGAAVSLFKWVSADFALGIPLTERRNAGDVQVHFAVHISPPIEQLLEGLG